MRTPRWMQANLGLQPALHYPDYRYAQIWFAAAYIEHLGRRGFGLAFVLSKGGLACSGWVWRNMAILLTAT